MTKWRLVISIWQGLGPVATRMPYFRRNSNPLQIVSANSHPGDVSNFKCKLVILISAWSQVLDESHMCLEGRHKWFHLMEKFWADLPERKKRFLPLSQKLKQTAVDLNFGENMAFLLVQDPALSKWPAFTSSYDGSNSGYAVKTRKSVKRQSDTKTQWNTSQVRPFYSFHWKENWI